MHSHSLVFWWFNRFFIMDKLGKNLLTVVICCATWPKACGHQMWSMTSSCFVSGNNLLQFLHHEVPTSVWSQGISAEVGGQVQFSLRLKSLNFAPNHEKHPTLKVQKSIYPNSLQPLYEYGGGCFIFRKKSEEMFPAARVGAGHSQSLTPIQIHSAFILPHREPMFSPAGTDRKWTGGNGSPLLHFLIVTVPQRWTHAPVLC